MPRSIPWPASPRVGGLLALLAGLVLAPAAPAQQPAAPAAAPTAQSLLQAAQQDLQAGRVDSALAGLRAALALAPDDADARLRLIRVLLDRGRAVEAAPEVRRLLAQRPDVAAHEAWLRQLELLGATAERADAAEQAVQRFPDHEPFAWAAAESLAASREPARAMVHWRRLSPATQATARAQFLLGSLHEDLGQPAQALAAYAAARDEPRARHAAQRLQARAVRLPGRLYFPPPGWLALPGDPVRLVEVRSGVGAGVAWQSGRDALAALRDWISRQWPIPADVLGTWPSGPRPATAAAGAPPSPLALLPVACAGGPGVHCARLKASERFALPAPDLYIAVREQADGALAVVLEGASPQAAVELLQALAGAGSLPMPPTP